MMIMCLMVQNATYAMLHRGKNLYCKGSITGVDSQFLQGNLKQNQKVLNAHVSAQRLDEMENIQKVQGNMLNVLDRRPEV